MGALLYVILYIILGAFIFHVINTRFRYALSQSIWKYLVGLGLMGILIVSIWPALVLLIILGIWISKINH